MKEKNKLCQLIITYYSKKEDTENYINGINTTQSTNAAFMSINNDRGFSRLYEPVATAAILSVVNGYDILNTSLSSADLTALENRKATVAETDEYILAEYIDIKTTNTFVLF